jgi:membrane protease YdiL (CAAX protease family)
LETDFKFEFGKWWKTLLIPTVVIVIVYAFVVCINRFPSISIGDPLIILDSAILVPVAEQILQTLLLTIFTSIFLVFITVQKNKWKSGIICFSALIVSAFIMAWVHFDTVSLFLPLKIFLFLIYGALYYLNDRNLLPSIIAHSVWNTIVII